MDTLYITHMYVFLYYYNILLLYYSYMTIENVQKIKDIKKYVEKI